MYKPLMFGLIGVCALLLCATIGYIFLDIRMTRAGLFQSAGMSALAVLLAVVVIAAIALMAYTAKMIIKNAKSPRDQPWALFALNFIMANIQRGKANNEVPKLQSRIAR